MEPFTTRYLYMLRGRLDTFKDAGLTPNKQDNPHLDKSDAHLCSTGTEGTGGGVQTHKEH